MEKSTHTKEYAALRAELKNARQTAGLSQRELAARLKVPHSWIAKVENGERRVDLVEFCWFLSACNVDAAAATSRLAKVIGSQRVGRQSSGGRAR
jgi:transcriptional regulator with XRE-family HTH domain